MLENLYSSTLVTRVNIALHHVIPSGVRCITIITCPGAFDSHDPDIKGGKSTVILPDWMALEGEYKPHDDIFPNLEELAFGGKVIAVGDTKLVSRRLASSGVDEKIKDTIAGTHSCHRSYLAQVQHYAKMLRTRFEFVLTNKELVLAQFLREEEPAPRLHDQRGLRSSTGPPLHLGLSSDFQSSSSEEMDESPVDELSPLYLSQPKRRHDSSDNPTLSRRSPAPVDPSEDQNIDGLPSTPSAPPTVVDDLPSSPPRPSQIMEQPMPRKLVSTPAQNAHQPLLPMRITTSPIQPNVLVGSPFGFFSSEPSFSQSSGTPYLSSERDHDIGKVLVKSFRIPNPCDKDEVRITKELHPAKALFVMLMHVSSVGALRRRMGKEEVLFGGQSREDK